jgi:hypothetical protein
MVKNYHNLITTCVVKYWAFHRDASECVSGYINTCKSTYKKFMVKSQKFLKLNKLKLIFLNKFNNKLIISGVQVSIIDNWTNGPLK